MTDETPKKQITRKQQAFIDAYLVCFNGAEAARRAGYSEKTARQTASDLLAESYISEQIDARMSEVHMSADEALKLTADIARGDVGEFLNDFGGVTMDEVRKTGKTKLIKKFKTKTITINGKNEDREIHTEEIELYSAQDALRDILKVHGKFIERVDLTTLGTKVTDIGVRQIDYRTGITDIESGSSADSSTPSQD